MGFLSDLFGGDESHSTTQSTNTSLTETRNINVDDAAGPVVTGDTSGNVTINTLDAGAVEEAFALGNDALALGNDALAANESVTINAQDTVADLAANAVGTVADSLGNISDTAIAAVDQASGRAIDAVLVSNENITDLAGAYGDDLKDIADASGARVLDLAALFGESQADVAETQQVLIDQYGDRVTGLAELFGESQADVAETQQVLIDQYGDRITGLASESNALAFDLAGQFGEQLSGQADNAGERLLVALDKGINGITNLAGQFADSLAVSSESALNRVSGAVADVNDLTANVVAPDQELQRRLVYVTGGVLLLAGLAVFLRR